MQAGGDASDSKQATPAPATEAPAAASSYHDDEAETVTLGKFLASRLYEIGVTHAFGVPGDFNLTL